MHAAAGSVGAPQATLTLAACLGPAPAAHVLIVVAMALSLCAGRLLQLQGFDSSSYSVDALTQTLPLLPSRGEITDRNGLVLAATEPAVAVTADPRLTAPQAAEIADVLAGHLGMTEAELMPLLTKPNTRFVYLKKKVPALTYSALAADLVEPSPARHLPRERPDPHLPERLRRRLGRRLRRRRRQGPGRAGVQARHSARRRRGQGDLRERTERQQDPARPEFDYTGENGLSYQLTLDSELQWVAERRLAEQVAKTRADSGFAIVLNVKTGQVLALANAPTYDSSKPQAARAEDRGNRAISAPYEPGSVEKVLTSAALIDSGTANPSTRVVIPHRLASDGALDQGPLRARDVALHDARGDRGLLQHRHRAAVSAARQTDAARLSAELRSGTHHAASSCRASPPASCRRPTCRMTSAIGSPSARRSL